MKRLPQLPPHRLVISHRDSYGQALMERRKIVRLIRKVLKITDS
jgi:hypothetical protein